MVSTRTICYTVTKFSQNQILSIFERKAHLMLFKRHNQLLIFKKSQKSEGFCDADSANLSDRKSVS